MDNRKGISPVVSVVMLMMVTAGAVGVVYTQFNSLLGGETEIDQVTQDTEIAINRLFITEGHTAGDDGGYIQLQITNTGEVTRNSTAFILTSLTGEDTSDSNCFTAEHSQLIDPANSFPQNAYTCNTTIPFPDPTQEVEIEVLLSGSAKTWEKKCQPRRTTSTVC